MAEVKRLKFKVVVVGDSDSGKSDLIRQVVLDNFDEAYLRTLGSRVAKKELSVIRPSGQPLKVDMTVWDVMGQKGFRELMKEAYFYGTKGIVAVCSVSRKHTLSDLDDWIEAVQSVTGPVPLVLLANETAKEERQEVSEADIEQAAKAHDCPFFLTSRTTPETLEHAFQDLAERIVAWESRA